MKKLLLFPILLLFFNSFSQDYVPFLDTNKMWIEEYNYDNTLNDIYKDIIVTTLELENDTLFNVFSQVISHEYYDPENTNPGHPFTTDYTIQSKTLISQLWEDTVNKIVFYEDGVLYDFNIYNDSMYLRMEHSESLYKTKLDSIVIKSFYNGQQHETFCVTGPGYICSPEHLTTEFEDYLKFNSKMGSTINLLTPFGQNDLSSEANSSSCRTCFIENREVLWGDSTDCTAYLRHLEYGDLGINNIESKENSFSIYPNPVSSEMTVQFDGANQSGTIQVLTIDGKVILEESFSNQNQVQLNLSEYNSGMYLIQFYSEENRKILTKRIIKN